jgi:hypothetical protein
MRVCYKKFWKPILVEKMHGTFPEFTLKETPSRKAADEAKPSGKPVVFIWNPIDKLTFTMEFSTHSHLDYFEGYCKWSEAGKLKAGVPWTMEPFSDAVISAPSATVFFQLLSGPMAGFKPEEIALNWPFWKPNSTIDDIAAFQAEFMADEMREIGDDEAKMRVQLAVDKAVADVKRCALPWFEKKLGWYLQREQV